MRVLLPCLALGLLVGCANVITADFPKPPEGASGTVVVYREAVFNTAGVAIPVTLDGREIAAIRVSSRVEIRVKPGMRVVGAGSLNMPINVESGATYYLSVDPSTNPALKLRTKDEARARIAETKLLASNLP